MVRCTPNTVSLDPSQNTELLSETMHKLYRPARAHIHVRSSVSCGQLETFSQAGANIVLYRFMFLSLQSANHSQNLAFNV